MENEEAAREFYMDAEREHDDVPPWARSDERHPERADEWRDLLAALDAERAAHAETRRERDTARALQAESGGNFRALDAILDAVKRERDDARAQVAALREAAASYADARDSLDAVPIYGAARTAWHAAKAANEKLRDVLASTTQAAAEHDARVRREALLEAATWDPDCDWSGAEINARLRKLAEEKP